MLRKLHRPSPAMAVALLALFVALSGTAVAAGIPALAKRALVAENAKKVNGQTAKQIAQTPGPATDATTLNGKTAAQIAGAPGPASSIPAGLVTYRTQSWSVNGLDQLARDTAECLPGEKAIGGGWDQDGGGIGYVLADRPVPDGSGWRVNVYGKEANDLPAAGTMWAVCLKVS